MILVQSMFDVISIGAATTDIFVKSPSLLVRPDNSFQTGYSVSLAHSSKNEISDSLICSGGGASNTSVSFSRLGLKSACLSLLGNDSLSNIIVSDLEDDHVSSDLLVRLDGEKTDFSVILVADDGGRAILVNRGSTSLQEPHIDWDKLKQTRWFYITSLEGNMDLLEKIIGFARENLIKVALNPGGRELKQSNRLIPLLPYVDFLLLNRTEAEDLVGISSDQPEFWSALSRLEPGIVSVTNGREGAHVISQDSQLFSPIINTKPVDETGAGDSFGSAFVTALIYGKERSEALFWGVKNSASVVSYLGAKTGLLTLKQIQINL